MTPKTADAIVEENATARIDGLRKALSVLAIFGLIAVFLIGGSRKSSRLLLPSGQLPRPSRLLRWRHRDR